MFAPYVTVAEFRAHPTYLDTNNIRTAGTQAEQDAALTNALLVASQWVDNTLDMPLGAHVQTEASRVRPTRLGQLRYHPQHAPVLAVTGISLGISPGTVAAQSTPQTWIEMDGRIIVAYIPGAAGLGSIQFPGPSADPSVEQLVQWTYIAGYPATQLTTDAAAGASTVTVRDATGIVAGSVLRLWTPGLEEAVTVTAVVGSTLTLAGTLAHAHKAFDSINALPATARLAVIYYAAATLMRPAPAAQQVTPSSVGGAVSPASASGDPRRVSGGANLVAEAQRLLSSFRRVR